MVFIEKKIDEKIICLHPKHREPLPFFNMLIWFFTLLCSILLLLRSSFKFLLRLKAVSGIFWKIYLTDLFIDKPFQCLLVTLLTFGRELLYVNTSRINVFFWGGKVWIEVIVIEKCDLFYRYHNAREIPFCLYCWNHVCKVNDKWCLVYWFHYCVSTQIILK